MPWPIPTATSGTRARIRRLSRKPSLGLSLCCGRCGTRPPTIRPGRRTPPGTTAATGLAGRFDTAAQIARPEHALPSTFAAAPGGWDDPEELAALPRNERLVLRALALARLLTAPPRRHDPFSDVAAATAWLGPLGAGDLDADRFGAWRAAVQPEAGRTRGGRSPAPYPALPPLLKAAEAALAWMESGATDQPDALVALAIAALRLARDETLRATSLPFWSAWPALGQPSDENLPRLRPAVARAMGGMDRAPWPISFLAFAAEAARAGLRDLDRLRAAAEAGRTLAEGLDKRARLPAAVDLVLASPVVTPRGVAERLGITLQAANRILGGDGGGGSCQGGYRKGAVSRIRSVNRDGPQDPAVCALPCWASVGGAQCAVMAVPRLPVRCSFHVRRQRGRCRGRPRGLGAGRGVRCRGGTQAPLSRQCRGPALCAGHRPMGTAAAAVWRHWPRVCKPPRSAQEKPTRAAKAL